MLMVATCYLKWSEEMFWSATPRKFIAVKNKYFELENARQSGGKGAPEKQKSQEVYIDQFFM